MKLPMTLLAAVSLSTLAGPALADAPMPVSPAEPTLAISLARPDKEVLKQQILEARIQQAIERERQGEQPRWQHDPDYCPPCGRG